jgi:hypothetical protein
MKYVKMLGMLAVAAAALMAFAGIASASTLTGPTTGTTATNLTATAGVTSLDGAFVTVTCQKSHVAGSVTSQGAAQTVKGNISALSFSECNFATTVESNGTLELHAIRPGVSPHTTCLAGDGDKCDGTLTSSGAKVTITTSVGSCTFTTNNTPIGTVTGSSTTGGKAKLDIQASIPRTGGSFLCGSSGTWTGSYTVDTPSSLWIDE